MLGRRHARRTRYLWEPQVLGQRPGRDHLRLVERLWQHAFEDGIPQVALEGLAQLEKVHVAWREEGVGRDLFCEKELLQRESRSGDSRWGAAE